MEVSGFTGDRQILNGLYCKDAEHDGRPAYKKSGMLENYDSYIYYWENAEDCQTMMTGWWISPSLGGDNGYAVSYVTSKIPPASGWRILETDADDEHATDEILVLPRAAVSKRIPDTEQATNKFQFGASRMEASFRSNSTPSRQSLDKLHEDVGQSRSRPSENRADGPQSANDGRGPRNGKSRNAGAPKGGRSASDCRPKGDGVEDDRRERSGKGVKSASMCRAEGNGIEDDSRGEKNRKGAKSASDCRPKGDGMEDDRRGEKNGKGVKSASVCRPKGNGVEDDRRGEKNGKGVKSASDCRPKGGRVEDDRRGERNGKGDRSAPMCRAEGGRVEGDRSAPVRPKSAMPDEKGACQASASDSKGGNRERRRENCGKGGNNDDVANRADRNGPTVVFGVNRGQERDRLAYPCDLCISKDGTIYVADTGNHRVVRLIPGSTNHQVILGGTRGKELHQLNNPLGVAIDDIGDLYVCDTGNHRVLRYTEKNLSGKYGRVKVMAGSDSCEKGSDLSRLNEPQGIVVDDRGVLYVADTQNHRVVKWLPMSRQGILVAGSQGKGEALDCLNSPVAVHVVRNIVTVADTNNHRVLQFNTARTGPEALVGKIVASGDGEGDSTLIKPHAVCMDRGILYVADANSPTGHRVVQVVGGVAKTVLDGRERSLNFNCVKFYKGDMFVASSVLHRIFKFPKSILPSEPIRRKESETVVAQSSHPSNDSNANGHKENMSLETINRQLERELIVARTEAEKANARLEHIVDDMATFVVAAERNERGGRIDGDDVWQLLAKWHPDNAPKGAEHLAARLMRTLTRMRT